MKKRRLEKAIKKLIFLVACFGMVINGGLVNKDGMYLHAAENSNNQEDDPESCVENLQEQGTETAVSGSAVIYLTVECLVESVDLENALQKKDFLVLGIHEDGSEEVLVDYDFYVGTLGGAKETIIGIRWKNLTAYCKVSLIEREAYENLQASNQHLEEGLGFLDNTEVKNTIETSLTTQLTGTYMPTTTVVEQPVTTTKPTITEVGQPVTTTKPTGQNKTVEGENNPKENGALKINLKNKIYRKPVKVEVKMGTRKNCSIVCKGKVNKNLKNHTVLSEEGKYTIIATDENGNSKKVSFEIAYTAKKLEVCCYMTEKWDQVAFFSKVKGTKRAVQWKLSNRKIGSIGKDGVFKAKKTGTVYVTAYIDKKSVKKKVVVDQAAKYVVVY